MSTGITIPARTRVIIHNNNKVYRFINSLSINLSQMSAINDRLDIPAAYLNNVGEYSTVIAGMKGYPTTRQDCPSRSQFRV